MTKLYYRNYGRMPRIGDVVDYRVDGLRYRVIMVGKSSVRIENIDKPKRSRVVNPSQLNLVERADETNPYKPTCHGDDHVAPRLDGGCDMCGKGEKKVDYANECHNDNHDPGCTCGSGKQGPDEDKTPETWIEEAQRIVGGDRQEDYGDAEDMTAKIAAVWSQYLGVEVTPRQFCWMMVLLKAMRDSHRNKRDCPVDAHGYLLLMEKCSHDES